MLEKKLAHCGQSHASFADEALTKTELGLSPTLSFSPPMEDMDDMESLVDSELDEDICAPTKHLVVCILLVFPVVYDLLSSIVARGRRPSALRTHLYFQVST